ncbi:hypothetical protein ACJX0J_014571, partial [Zea mays]
VRVSEQLIDMGNQWITVPLQIKTDGKIVNNATKPNATNGITSKGFNDKLILLKKLFALFCLEVQKIHAYPNNCIICCDEEYEKLEDIRVNPLGKEYLLNICFVNAMLRQLMVHNGLWYECVRMWDEHKKEAFDLRILHLGLHILHQCGIRSRYLAHDNII